MSNFCVYMGAVFFQDLLEETQGMQVAVEGDDADLLQVVEWLQCREQPDDFTAGARAEVEDEDLLSVRPCLRVALEVVGEYAERFGIASRKVGAQVVLDFCFVPINDGHVLVGTAIFSA